MEDKKSIKMFFRRVTAGLLSIGLMLFFGTVVLPTAASAQGASEEAIVLPGFYPDKFDDTGHIDRLTEHEIVIDDSLRKLSPYAEYATPTQRHVTIASFKVGDHVGYITDSKRRIISLWLIE